MKTAMNNLKMMTLFLVITFTLAFTPTIKADTIGDLGETPAVLKYIGSVNNQPIFQLSLNNKDADEVYITVTDANGTVVYTEKISGKDITRKYRLNTDEIEVTGLQFQVSSKKNNNKFLYTIQQDAYYVENSVVSK